MTEPTIDTLFDGWVDAPGVARKLDALLTGADDGDLYLQYTQSESFRFSEGRLRSSSLLTSRGFGLRCVAGDVVGFAHSNELTPAALDRAVDAVRSAKLGIAGEWDMSPPRTNHQIFTDRNPLVSATVENKIATLGAIESYAHGLDPRVFRVTVRLDSEWSAVEILRGGGERYSDRRPLVGLVVTVAVTENGRTESGTEVVGGRTMLDTLLDEASWQAMVREALRKAIVKLGARPAPAGQHTLVMAAGWPGVMVHEAVGHGFEGDQIRTGDSVYAGKLGEQVAAKGVTIIDQGNIADRRGSLTIDDEGTPTQENVLIEDGRLVGFMHDRLSARQMGVKPTGNGRRQDFASMTLPRMTNTFLASGAHDPDEIIASVDHGIYAASLGGGQVNPVTGDFVFECDEAYMIRGGRIEEAVKGATLIGNGPKAMQAITMVGNNSKLDSGSGVCGKMGQNLPVGVGQPTLRMESMTIGGTA